MKNNKLLISIIFCLFFLSGCDFQESYVIKNTTAEKVYDFIENKTNLYDFKIIKASDGDGEFFIETLHANKYKGFALIKIEPQADDVIIYTDTSYWAWGPGTNYSKLIRDFRNNFNVCKQDLPKDVERKQEFAQLIENRSNLIANNHSSEKLNIKTSPEPEQTVNSSLPEKAVNENTETANPKPTATLVNDVTPVKTPEVIKGKVNNIDEKLYQRAKEELNSTEYQIYRVAERLIRINNLSDKNWRFYIDIENPVSKPNASAGYVSLVVIKSSLLDSFSGDINALAFILSHELAHNILEHPQKSYEKKVLLENNRKSIELQKAKLENEYAAHQADFQRSNDSISSTPCQTSGDVIAVGTVSFINGMLSGLKKNNIENNYKQLNQRIITESLAYIELCHRQELEADSYAVHLMKNAGFDQSGAIRVLDFIEKMEVNTEEVSTHPKAELRKKVVLLESDNYVTKPTLSNKVSPLPYEKSMDGQSLIIKAPLNAEKIDQLLKELN